MPMRKSTRAGAAASLLLVGLPPSHAVSYTPENHERSVREAAAVCEDEHATEIEEADLAAIIRGAREPDDLSLALVEIGAQRIEPGARGKRRDINATRIAEQSFHGSPNPTRRSYGVSKRDREQAKQAIPTLEAELLPDRFALDVHSYDTNQAVRNKLLLNASQLLCVSLAHGDDQRSGSKLGNLLHMVGDTYSASHVQRSAPVGGADACGTEKIEWHFSMDLIVWKAHAPADQVNDDWRFSCLVDHAAQLIRMWLPARKAVREAPDVGSKLEKANHAVGQAVDYLCGNVFREDPEILRRPAGGAAAGYSIASGTDNWASVFTFWRKRPKDQPIQPVGLTGPEEARAFVDGVNEDLKSRGRLPYFVYPARDAGDFCEESGQRDELPAALRCTRQEIEWAMDDSDKVENLVIPPRSGAFADGQ
jgi:hypothetical protein